MSTGFLEPYRKGVTVYRFLALAATLLLPALALAATLLLPALALAATLLLPALALAGSPRPPLTSTPQLRVTITGNGMYDGVYIADYLPQWAGGVRGVYGWRAVSGSRCVHVYGVTLHNGSMSLGVTANGLFPHGWRGPGFQGGLDPTAWDITSGALGSTGTVRIQGN